MDLKEAAKLTGVQLSVANRLHEEGFINNPVTDHCISLLRLTAHFRKNTWYIKRFSSGLSSSKVKKILNGRNYSKLENYVISLYTNSQKRLKIEDVISMVENYFGKHMSENEIKRLRQIAYNRKHARIKHG